LLTFEIAPFICVYSVFWYLFNISMFELLAVPQRGTPYVHNNIYCTRSMWQFVRFCSNLHTGLIGHN
jgi:hypothetical protein